MSVINNTSISKLWQRYTSIEVSLFFIFVTVIQNSSIDLVKGKDKSVFFNYFCESRVSIEQQNIVSWYVHVV